MNAHRKHPKMQDEQSTDDKHAVASKNDQSDTEYANSEIRKAHFCVQENT